jgi:GNAT superfamily N-acetyltransferase
MAIDTSAAGIVSAALPYSSPLGSLQIVELEQGHVAEAARLHVATYRHALEANALLPRELLNPAPVESLLRRAIAAGPAVAAVRYGELAGYMAGFAVPRLRGVGVGTHLPEWAHGAREDGRAETYEALYAAISARWAETGHLSHFVSVLAGDPELEESLIWLGFGLCVAEAIRDLRPVPARLPVGVTVRQAAITDLEALGPLADAHEAYYPAAPTFLFRGGDDARAKMEVWLRTPAESVWVAESEGRLVSFIYMRPPHGDVCRALREPGTIAIGGAFTVPEARGRGAASALLAAIVEWARRAGFERIAVDFETANPLARRFWLRHFSPICLTFERHLDDRLAAGRPGTEAVR